MQLPLLWVPQENLSWYSVLNIYHKVTLAVKCRLIVPEFVDVEPGLLELFENVTGVRFFETQCSFSNCRQRAMLLPYNSYLHARLQVR